LKHNNSDSQKIFKNCLKNLNKVSLWLRYLDFCLNTDSISWEDIIKEYKTSMTRISKKEESWTLREEFLEKVAQKYNLERIREVYNITISMTGISQKFFEKCIELEKSQPKPDVIYIRKLYDKVLADFGYDAEDLWLDYIQFETLNNEFKKASDLHWKAKKKI